MDPEFLNQLCINFKFVTIKIFFTIRKQTLYFFLLFLSYVISVVQVWDTGEQWRGPRVANDDNGDGAQGRQPERADLYNTLHKPTCSQGKNYPYNITV